MTAAGVHRAAAGSGPVPAGGQAYGWLRLPYLHLISRRGPAALALLAGFSALLWTALHWHWNVAGGPAAALVIPLVLQTGAAAVVAAATLSPLGEAERATGRWLPYLRLGVSAGLTATAIGALAVGSTGGQLPGGLVAMARNVAGVSGIGLLSAAVLGAILAWTGPMAYLVTTETVLAGNVTTPWVWPGRPPGDLGGALCAALVFATGLVVVTVRGPRQSGRE